MGCGSSFSVSWRWGESAAARPSGVTVSHLRSCLLNEAIAYSNPNKYYLD